MFCRARLGVATENILGYRNERSLKFVRQMTSTIPREDMLRSNQTLSGLDNLHCSSGRF